MINELEWIKKNEEIELLNKKLITEKNQLEKTLRKLKDKGIYLNSLFMIFLIVLSFFSSDILNHLLIIFIEDSQISFYNFLLFINTDPLIPFDSNWRTISLYYPFIYLIPFVIVFFYMLTSSFVLDEKRIPHFKWLCLTLFVPFPMLIGLVTYTLILSKRTYGSVEISFLKKDYSDLKDRISLSVNKIEKIENYIEIKKSVLLKTKKSIYLLNPCFDFEYFILENDYKALKNKENKFYLAVNESDLSNNLSLSVLLTELSTEFKNKDVNCECIKKVKLEALNNKTNKSFKDFEKNPCSSNCIVDLKNKLKVKKVFKLNKHHVIYLKVIKI